MSKHLRVPGPTPLPPRVLQAMSHPMINHRGIEFRELFKGLLADLRHIFQTEGDILLISASGTGGLEAALVNVIEPGDRVLAVTSGYFGDRFAAIAEVLGAEVSRLSFPWGTAADPEAIEDHLSQYPNTKAVLVTHNETSTGITNDLRVISNTVHARGETSPLLLVDAVSSLAAIDLPTDAWKCDIVITCSQKALMAPPGIALLSVNPRAWRIIERTPRRSYYFDLSAMRQRAQDGETPATPPISDVFGLREGTNMILEEGLHNVFSRHASLASQLREGLLQLGLTLFADPEFWSNTVTAVAPPEGLPAEEVRARLREAHGIVTGGGQGPLKGKIFRIGHMGYITEEDIDQVLVALRSVLG